MVIEDQTAAAVLMVRPASFGFNPQTAASNSFQHAAGETSALELQRHAIREFDGLAQKAFFQSDYTLNNMADNDKSLTSCLFSALMLATIS